MIVTASAISRTRRPRRAFSLAAFLESLETRTLLSGITSYQSGDLFQPGPETADNQGNVWIADALQIDKVTKMTDGTVVTTSFSTNQISTDIVFDPVNNHLFVADGSGPLVEYDLNGNVVNQYTTANQADAPQFLTVANDGSVWFNGFGSFANDADSTYTTNIGRMDLSGNFTFQAIPTNTQISIAPAPDGSVWFATAGSDSVTISGPSFLGHATFSGGAIGVTTYSVPEANADIDSVVVASDNTVWYAAGGDGNSFSHKGPVVEGIGHATLTGSSISFATYDLPKTSGDGIVDPGHMAIDATGQIWFTDLNAIDTIDPATGDITRTSPNDPGASPAGLAISGNDVIVDYLSGNNNLVDVDTTTFMPPIVGADPEIAATTGQAFSGPVAIFASSDAGPFTYTINFGNGSTQTGTLAFNSSGVYTISGSTTYAASGTYNVLVSVVSSEGDVASLNGSAVVTTTSGTIPLIAAGINLQVERGLNLSPNVSGQSNVVVAQFSGPVAGYSAVIHWGDSTSSTGQIVSLGNNQYYVELPGTKSYAAIGTYNVSVDITDGTHSVTATSTATVSAVPVVASQNLVLTPLLAGIVVADVANFTADTGSSASWFRATINWGDSKTSSGLVVKTSAGNYIVLGLHIYAKKGTYHVTTTITDTPDHEVAIATASIVIK